MLATVQSATLLGVDGHRVAVEVHIGSGIPGYTIVGLPDAAGRESRERVRAAMISSGVAWPLKRLTVNLSPATVRKTGAGLELAIALGLMLAEDHLASGCLDGVGVLGELGLDGSLRPVPGTLVLADALRRTGAETVVVPPANVHEAALVPGLRVRTAPDLGASCGPASRARSPGPTWTRPSHRRPTTPPSRSTSARSGASPPPAWRWRSPRPAATTSSSPDHPAAARPCSPAACPRSSPPRPRGSGRGHPHRLGRRRDSPGGLATDRPFRAPHHTATTPALVGGGSGRPRPGEVTLAHRGVLFLDELGEFPPVALDALRQPLEESVVRIARQGATLGFPVSFLLVACTNPCPCGRSAVECRCTEHARARYARRLSAPLLDRFDLRLRITGPAAATCPASPRRWSRNASAWRLPDSGNDSATPRGAGTARCRLRSSIGSRR